MYCTLKLCIKDNTKGDALNSMVNKSVTFFGWPHHTLAWIHKPAILQCSLCMCWGHHVSACRSVYPFCAVCAGPHQTHSHEVCVAKGFINSALKLLRCVNCITAKKNSDHKATSNACPFSRSLTTNGPLQICFISFTIINFMASSHHSILVIFTLLKLKYLRVGYTPLRATC